ncbi:MAG: polyketide cyclase [Cyclobacteriaceae bacterium]
MTKLSKYSWIVSAIILIAGFLFLHFDLVEYGATFFMIFPLASGFTIGTHDKRKRGVYSLALALLIFFGFLLAGALEGLICVLMALPIFLLMMYFGYRVQRKLMKNEPSDSGKAIITISPLLLLIVINPIEQMILPEPTIETIETAITLDYAPEIVFDAVKEMDKLDAEKPIGLILGLPSPFKCELESNEVGAKRNCLFENGKIVAEITKYEKGKTLEMDVIDYTLTGREWFEFVDASYTFEAVNEQTIITRTSSYKSVLNPRFYWKPLETWGIEQEHTFVLNSLKKNLREKYGDR